MEKHCTSLEISKALKSAGWKKETEFSYCDTADKRFGRDKDERFFLYPKETASNRRYNTNNKDIQYPAPLATEILEELPKKDWYISEQRIWYGDKYFDINYNKDMSLNYPNALAKMWPYLHKKGG